MVCCPGRDLARDSESRAIRFWNDRECETRQNVWAEIHDSGENTTEQPRVRTDHRRGAHTGV